MDEAVATIRSVLGHISEAEARGAYEAAGGSIDGAVSLLLADDGDVGLNPGACMVPAAAHDGGQGPALRAAGRNDDSGKSSREQNSDSAGHQEQESGRASTGEPEIRAPMQVVHERLVKDDYRSTAWLALSTDTSRMRDLAGPMQVHVNMTAPTFKDAFATARREKKWVLLFMASSSSFLSKHYVRHVLANETLAAVLNEHCVCAVHWVDFVASASMTRQVLHETELETLRVCDFFPEPALVLFHPLQPTTFVECWNGVLDLVAFEKDIVAYGEKCWTNADVDVQERRLPSQSDIMFLSCLKCQNSQHLHEVLPSSGGLESKAAAYRLHKETECARAWRGRTGATHDADGTGASGAQQRAGDEKMQIGANLYAKINNGVTFRMTALDASSSDDDYDDYSDESQSDDHMDGSTDGGKPQQRDTAVDPQDALQTAYLACDGTIEQGRVVARVTFPNGKNDKIQCAPDTTMTALARHLAKKYASLTGSEPPAHIRDIVLRKRGAGVLEFAGSVSEAGIDRSALNFELV